jgi:hypothetical protein
VANPHNNTQGLTEVKVSKKDPGYWPDNASVVAEPEADTARLGRLEGSTFKNAPFWNGAVQRWRTSFLTEGIKLVVGGGAFQKRQMDL